MSNEPLVETIHDQFNALDADVTFRSSDRVLFRLHKRNMAITSGGFPGPEVDSTGQIIDLSEPSAVLEVVFQFLYPERHPKLADKIDLLLLLQIAEAAQKYDVYMAIDACDSKFLEVLLDNYRYGIKIMAYALRHNNHKLADACALRLCRYPLSDVVQGIPQEYALPWIRYQEKCSKMLFEETELDSFHPIDYLGDTTATEDDLICSLDILNWLRKLKHLPCIDEISRGALQEFARRHMDRMPHHDDYSNISEEICPLVQEALDSVRSGRRNVEKESFSSYYIANQT